MDFTDLYFTRYCNDATKVWWYIMSPLY